MKNRTCCFTGHREIPTKELEIVKAKTKEAIIHLINAGVCNFISGGARGYDTLAAELVLELKQYYPKIKLLVALPCINQCTGWNEKEFEKYHFIKENADRIIILSDKYYRGCMHVRNRYMVDNSTYCICYNRKNRGGTVYTVNYAIKKKVSLIYI